MGLGGLPTRGSPESTGKTGHPDSSGATIIELRERRARAGLDPQGGLRELHWRSTRWIRAGRPLAGEIEYGTNRFALADPRPTRRTANSVTWEFVPGDRLPIRVTLEYAVRSRGRALVLRREVRVTQLGPLGEHLTLRLPHGLGSLAPETWLPLADGRDGRWSDGQPAVFRSAGPARNDDRSLALPLASDGSTIGDWRITVFTDPFYATRFTSEHVEWTYPAPLGLENGREERSMELVLHPGGLGEALAQFSRGALPGVPAGPRWLHDIAMVGFDYLSDGGEGWFRDGDRLASSLTRAERRRVFLCLHGWYDFIGRYCFTPGQPGLDQEWTAFPKAAEVNRTHVRQEIGGTPVEFGFAGARALPMTADEVRRRLRWARKLGFRVGLYFADGLSAGDGLPGFDERRVLYWGGWRGPDSAGRTYCQNPLLPEVQEFFTEYLEVLLREFGADVDALVWDETFHVPAGTMVVGPGGGYADRAMLRLVDRLRQRVDRFNREHRREVAFLVSDCAGVLPKPSPPCALFAHGTYQDSHYRPDAWGPAFYPNHRNVAWSTCWWPISKWDWVQEGARRYGAPVPISNGWGDDLGLAEMTPEIRERFLGLFRERLRLADRERLLKATLRDPRSLP